MLKIWSTDLIQRIAEVIREPAGPAGAVVGRNQTDDRGTIDILDVFYKALSSTIYGGSNEIQRNIISKRVLALPT